MRLLLVEDEAAIAKTIRCGLEEARYRVDWAADGSEALRLAEDNTYAAILLDVMLPGIDGFTLCATLRSHRNTTPILMLTARDIISDRVRGLDNGADDYLVKPFDFQELLARIRALLRRDKVHRSGSIRIADLEIDTNTQTVTRAERSIPLTPREYTLLHALAVNEGRVLTREIIQNRVWMEEDTHPNTVAVHVGNLRRKVDEGFPIRLIHTIHGFGYTLKRLDDR